MLAVITGGSSRTGLKIVEHLLEQNYTVLTNFYSNDINLEKLKKRYNNFLYYMQINFNDFDEITRFIEFIKSYNTKIDLIINTFGDYINRDLLDLNSKDFSYMLNTNLIYIDDLIKNLYPLFNENGGSIINFGYSHGDKIIADIQTTYYHIAKMGLILLTKAYAKSLGKLNISVNMISPGVLENSVVIPEDVKKIIPMNKLGKLKDIIKTIDYLTKNKYVTGNNIIVSGGYNV